MKQLSVIIPAFNEEGSIAGTLAETSEYLISKKYEYEILVLNDGSSDGTAQKVKAMAGRFPGIRLIDCPDNRGKGQRVKEGVARAGMPLCLFMDADNSTSICEWDKFEPLFENGADVVVASRHLPDSCIAHPQPFMRRMLGAGYRALCRGLFGLNLSDINCGFKAYRTGIAKRVYAETVMRDWTFDVEVFCLLKKYGVSFKEIPVEWRHKQKKSESAFWSPLHTAWRMLKSVFVLKKRFG